jgi:hypothetical protein
VLRSDDATRDHFPAHEDLRRAFAQPDIERRLRPLIGMEECNVPARQ